MNNSNVSQIKRSQKESLLLKELSKMLHQLSLDDSELDGLFINRVQLSRDKSVCTILFYDPAGFDVFKQKMPALILYKPSLRKGLASVLSSKYVPDLKFAFDAKFEKQQRIESIIDSVKEEFNEEE